MNPSMIILDVSEEYLVVVGRSGGCILLPSVAVVTLLVAWFSNCGGSSMMQ